VTPSNGIGMMEVRGGVMLRADPAREPCFTVVHHQDDMAHLGDEYPPTPASQREKLHTDFNNEIQSLEIAAQTLVDFPDAPWVLRTELARQCWDETRHARLCLIRLEAKGGYMGEFPIINQEWGVVCRFDSLAARLAVQNRLFEGGSLDVLQELVGMWADIGDHDTSDVTDAIIADEVRHVGFGNEWLDEIRKANPRDFLKALAAMNELGLIATALAPAIESEMPHDVAVNNEDRARAGFST
jgi:uncharacterized ferritin-like protein (DUF455 family)